MLSAVRAFDKGGSLKRLDPDELDSSFSSNSSTDPLSKATGFMALGEASLYPLFAAMAMQHALQRIRPQVAFEDSQSGDDDEEDEDDWDDGWLA